MNEYYEGPDRRMGGGLGNSEVERWLTRLEEKMEKSSDETKRGFDALNKKIDTLAFVRQDVWAAEKLNLEAEIHILNREMIEVKKYKADSSTVAEVKDNLKWVWRTVVAAAIGGGVTIYIAAVAS